MKGIAVFAGPLIQLRMIPAFEPLSAGQLAALAAEAEEVALASGAPFFEVGQPVDAAYLLVEGSATAVGPDGASAAVSPGEVVGFLETLARAPARTRVTADTDVLAIRLSLDAIRDACDQHFGVLSAVLSYVAGEAARERKAVWVAAGAGAGEGEARQEPMDRVDRILTLHRSPVFPSGGMDALAELAGHLVERELAPGEKLWPPGDGPEGVFLIASGSVRLESDVWEGSVLLGAGGVPGLVTSLAERSGIRAWADSAVTALYVSRETLLDILEDHSDMAFAFLGRLAGSVLEGS